MNGAANRATSVACIRGLADAPGLDYTMAAEVLWLIETLEAAGK